MIALFDKLSFGDFITSNCEVYFNKNIFFNPQVSQTRLSKMPRCGAIARHERVGYADYLNH